jgi:D-beta-D-heptose 7-phosphate kinase/D-beta-D-heptose 1-phosphate adenosyltransferase
MTPSLKTILEGTHGLDGKYIPNFEILRRQVELLKEGGYHIVLTQGVYDMFHVGHGRYLETASEFGDVLIVGVDSDELTRQMKGDDRPFDGFEERIELLAMLSFVNVITRRDVDQHYNDLIRLVRPDVLVMSKTTSTFTEERKKEIEEYCGRIEHLEPRAAPETTSTTAKLRRMRVEGAKELGALLAQTVENYLRGDGDA